LGFFNFANKNNFNKCNKTSSLLQLFSIMLRKKQQNLAGYFAEGDKYQCYFLEDEP